MHEPITTRKVSGLRDQVRNWRVQGLSVGLVPTMGALHDGHLSLVQLAKSKVDRVVVSIFVNPTQFAPHEDFDAYPRNEDADISQLATAGCNLVFAPSIEEMYRPGAATTVTVSGVSGPLDGQARPGHFAGVATVVTKLLSQCAPDIAVFGEKDFQQLQVIRRLVIDLDLPVEVVGAPIMRAPDGLALSSRNAYLSPTERRIAPTLYKLLQDSAQRLQSGDGISEVEAHAVERLVQAGFGHVDYFEVRASESLARFDGSKVEGNSRLLAAAHLGKTRLIDNIAV